MRYVMSSCKNLRWLEIHGTGVIGDSLVKSLPHSRSIETVHVGVNCQISAPAVEEVLKSCRNTIVDATFQRVKIRHPIPSSDFPRFQSLKRLRLQCGENLGAIDIAQLSQCTPNVESLTLAKFALLTDDLTGWKHLRYLELSNTSLTTTVELPVSLVHLLLLNLYNVPERPSSADDQKPYKLPLLETFNCTGTAAEGDFITAITKESIKHGNLKSLSIGGRLVEQNVPVQDEFPAAQSVEGLSLGFLMVKEQRLMQIANLYPNITKLDVSGTEATGVAVKAFAQMGVKYLKLNECHKVSPDAVEWARGQGLEVEFNFPSRRGNVMGYRDIGFF